MEPVKSYNLKENGPMEPAEQAATFYNVLSRGGQYPVFFCRKGDKKVNEKGQEYSPMYSYCVRNEESFWEQYNQYGSSTDCYLTVNEFSGKWRWSVENKRWGFFRKKEDCKYINDTFIDIDIMKAKSTKDLYTVEKGDKLVAEVLAYIEKQIELGNLKRPTMVVLSGSGIQLHYIYAEPVSVNDSRR